VIEISEIERRALIESLETALAEMEASDEFSQGSVDGLYEAVRILGGKVNV
jgi:hypothetical protein